MVDSNFLLTFQFDESIFTPIKEKRSAMSKNPLHEILKTLTKYEGNTRLDRWITRLEDYRVLYKQNEIWVIKHLDLLLAGSALNWWLSREDHFLDRVENEADKSAVWTDLRQEMREVFGTEALRAQARIRNHNIRFRKGEDPQAYVMSKLQCLTEMDPTMSEDDRVMHLIQGLTKEMQDLMSTICIEGTTSTEFLRYLRGHTRFKPAQNNEEMGQSSSSKPSQPWRNYAKAASSFGRGRTDEKPRGRIDFSKLVTPDGRKICGFCGIPGHLMRDCRKRKREQEPSSTQMGSNQTGAQTQQRTLQVETHDPCIVIPQENKVSEN